MQLENLKTEIINTINAANLPIDAIYYVFKDIMGEITATYSQTLQQEAIEKQKQQEEQNKKEEENKEQEE